MIPTRTGHPFWMHEELQATPAALERALAPDAAVAAHRDAVAARLASCARIYLTGCGTALHAALAGAALLRDLAGNLVELLHDIGGQHKIGKGVVRWNLLRHLL